MLEPTRYDDGSRAAVHKAHLRRNPFSVWKVPNLFDFIDAGKSFAPRARHVAAAAAGSMLVALSGCSWLHMPSVSMPHIPYVNPAPPDMTPARDSADNMVRIDAALRSGCESVLNIEKPPTTPGAAASTAPQRWVAHTCSGDLSYDIVTEKSPQGPVVKVLPVNSPINKPMNPNTIPATPDE
jgi:hypothetical protein